ncbi:leucine zipper domain-containing protein [Pseudonocardia ailaonensis]|uniref:leucine zipper domain-containing protein n=1 Tax=Pseudonocardia ailaonensis TaxID=367279 RepID=UPI003CD0B054
MGRHANARTTVNAQRLVVTRGKAGRSAARIAEQLGISRVTVHKWICRYREESWAGRADRSSRSHRSPTRTPPRSNNGYSRCASTPYGTGVPGP